MLESPGRRCLAVQLRREVVMAAQSSCSSVAVAQRSQEKKP